MTALEQATGGFVTVARSGDVEPGSVRVVEVDGRSLCIGLTEDGEWGAIDNVCTHDGGTLGEGELDALLREAKGLLEGDKPSDHSRVFWIYDTKTMAWEEDSEPALARY